MEPRAKRQRTSRRESTSIVRGGDTENGNDTLSTDDWDSKPHKKPAPPSRSLFIRSLPSTATTANLTEFFSQKFAIKHATVVTDPETKKSKGYGFLTFADAEDAKMANEQLNGSLFEGRKIRLEVAEPRHREAGTEGHDSKIRLTTSTIGPKADRDRRQLESQKPPKLIVRNLPWSINEPELLAQLFRSYGKVKHATIPKSKPGTSAGFGFVVLRGRKNAEKALAGVNGKVVEGRTLAVDWAVEKDAWQLLQKDHHNEAESTALMDENQINEDGSPGVFEDDGDDVDLEDVPSGDADNSEFSIFKGDSMSGDDIKLDSSTMRNNNNAVTLFVRNLPFTCTDEVLLGHFKIFGAIRYARVVLDQATERPRGTGFVCFYNVDDANACLQGAPRIKPTLAETGKSHTSSSLAKRHSVLEDTMADPSGRYTIDGRLLQVSRAVDRDEALRLTVQGSSGREARDRDKRRLYLLSEGTIPSNSPVYVTLSATELKLREDSAKQRQALIKSNPSLHLSLTRLSIRNIPRWVTSKDLKALAREAVVGFAKDVKGGLRSPLTKEELSRGGEEMRAAEKERKAKGNGIVKQAKIVYEGREGGKVSEKSGAGRSRGYGFIEYYSHRSALMGLRWLNGHSLRPVLDGGKSGVRPDESPKRLITEFAIENAQVVTRRHEQEIKARGNPRMMTSGKDRAEVKEPLKTPILRKRATDKPQKGVRKSSDHEDRQGAALLLGGLKGKTTIKHRSDTTTRRQQIIGRKRTLRRAKKPSAS